MGLFSRGKKSATPITNKVWKNGAARMKGLLKECLLALKSGQTPVVLVWFSESRESLLHHLRQTGIPHFLMEEDAPNPSGVAIIDAGKDLGRIQKIAVSASPAFYWLGRYPLSTKEEACLTHIRAAYPEAPGHYCLALDDAIFEAFAGQQLVPLLEKLGLGDDECIEHKMVDKAIDNALQKIGSHVTVERTATSEKQWFTLNYTAS
jgi:preprotein translocase subunit SecA